MAEPSNSKKRSLFSTEDRRNIGWFWRTYIAPRAPLLVVLAALILLQAGVYQQFLSLTESGLRVIFDKGTPSDLLRIAGFVFALFALRALLAYAVPRLSAEVSTRAVRQLRDDLTAHIMRLDLAWFERTRPGEIIQRLVVQSQSLSNFFAQSTVSAARDLTTIIVVSGWLIWKSPLLFSFAVIFIPLVAWLLRLIGVVVRRRQQDAEQVFGRYISAIEEMTGAMRTVKIAGQERAEQSRIGAIAEDVRLSSIRTNSVQALTVPMIDLVSGVIYVVIIGGGGYMVMTDGFGLDAAGIITFMLGLVLVFDPARNLARFTSSLQGNLVLLERVRSLLDLTPLIQNRPNAVTEFDPTGDIRFEDVHFAYAPDASLFSGLSLTIPAGQTTAIVGATGSGKTTVLSLLTRLYEISGGRITIGGTDIRDIQIEALRGAFSVIAQDIIIFDASIADNIRYVRPDATDAQVRDAAAAAEIGALMTDRGADTLGTRGAMLSGGQKQRIAIARAALRPSPILLQDEATSALDQRTEEKVRSALNHLAKGRTTLIVSHRLSAVTEADQILVLDSGRLVEQGSHDELIQQDGLYAAMYQAQKTGYR